MVEPQSRWGQRLSPTTTIRWAAAIFLVPFLELLGRNILGNHDDLQPLIFDWTLVAFFGLLVVWLLVFASRAAAMLLLIFSIFSLGTLASFIFVLVPRSDMPTIKVYDFALLFLWISASVLMFQAFQAARAIHRGRRADLAVVFS
jgi:hypothetical protein